MSTLCIPSISRAYAARVATRHRHHAIGRRSRPVSTMSTLTPARRRHHHSPSSTTHHRHYQYNANRKILRTLNDSTLCHHFSSQATVDDDNENNVTTNNDEDDNDSNALTLAISKLKSFRDNQPDDDEAKMDEKKEEEQEDVTITWENEEDDPTVDNDEDPMAESDNDHRDDTTATSTAKLDLLDVMKSSPFEDTTSASSSSHSTNNTVGGDPLNIIGSSNDDNDADKKPSLSDLLQQTDLFTKSWSEPDIDSGRDRDRDRGGSSSSSSRSGYYEGSDSYSGGNRPNFDTKTKSSWPYSDSTKFGNDTTPTTTSSHSSTSLSSILSETAPSSSWNAYNNDDYDDDDDDDYSSGGYSEYQSQSHQVTPSAAKLEYDEILQQTNDLLEKLTSQDNDNDLSTLQLMDFDEVMTKWSKFHTKVDTGSSSSTSSGSNYDDNGSFSFGESRGGGGYHHSYHNQFVHQKDEDLKSKASDQCMKLLHALEENYDRIHHHHEGEEEAASTKKYTQLMPNAASYNLALHALAHSGKGTHVAEEAASILERMLERCQRYLEKIVDGEDESEGKSLLPPPPPFEPTIITYNSVVHAIAKSGAKDAGHLAEEVYAKMEQWREKCAEQQTKVAEGNGKKLRHQYSGVLPNARTLACVIDAWANVKTAGQQSFAAERAEAILDSAVERRRIYVASVTGNVVGGQDAVDGDSLFADDTVFTVEDDDIIEEEVVDEELQLLDNIGGVSTTISSIGTEVEEEMPSSPISSSATVAAATMAAPYASKPNTVAFNSVIYAWASSGRGREGALRAHELLARLEALSESGELDLPDEQDNDDGDNDDDWDRSLKPNARTYSMVMNAWANVSKQERGSGDAAASCCEEMLLKMEERGAVDSSVRPNLVAYVTAISAWARAAQEVEHAASRAEHILNRMIDLYYGGSGDDGDEDDAATAETQPSQFALEGDVENARHDAPFNSVITAYARSKDPTAADRAMAVLERLEATNAIEPTVTTYNSVMDACAKQGEPDLALEVLDKMTSSGARVQPDATSYDTVLNAFARCEREGMAERAYNFLRRLEGENKEGFEGDYDNNSYITTSSTSYSTVINAFARASGNRNYGGIHAVKTAKEIYDRLIDRVGDGTIHPFGRGDANDSYANSCFLNCCANVYGTRMEKKEALVMAITAFEDMKKKPDLHGTPNQYTFGTMMKVCARLSYDDGEKFRLMESIFTQACRRGHCSSAVLGQFLRHTPSRMNARVILELGGSKRDIPHEWYRNVPRRQWPMPAERGGNDSGYN